MAVLNSKKNCSNCGWNYYSKGNFSEGAVKVKCLCAKKCIKYNQWKPFTEKPESPKLFKPIKPIKPPTPPGLEPKNEEQGEK